MRRLSLFAPFSTLLLLGLLSTERALGDCAMREPDATGTTTASNIKVLGADCGGDFCQSCIDSAVATWNGSCGGYENPTFVGTSGTASFSSFVRFMAGSNPGTLTDCSGSKCACAFVSYDSQGQVVGGTIRVWQTAGTQACSGSASALLTHELAHLLGLADPPAGCSCSNIMGDVNGSIDAQVCQTIDEVYRTGDEIAVGDPPHPCSNPPK